MWTQTKWPNVNNDARTVGRGSRRAYKALSGQLTRSWIDSSLRQVCDCDELTVVNVVDDTRDVSMDVGGTDENSTAYTYSSLCQVSATTAQKWSILHPSSCRMRLFSVSIHSAPSTTKWPLPLGIAVPAVMGSLIVIVPIVSQLNYVPVGIRWQLSTNYFWNVNSWPSACIMTLG